jgi:hypothetical protein
MTDMAMPALNYLWRLRHNTALLLFKLPARRPLSVDISVASEFVATPKTL